MPITDLILVTTTDMASDRLTELRRLFASVEQFRRSRPDVHIHHHVLLQRCTDPIAARGAIGAPDTLILTSVDRQVPLSVARNMMLDVVLADPPSEHSVLAFPDDDAWYPDGTMEHIVARFEADAELDLWFCHYGTQAAFTAGVHECAPSLQNVLSYASSNTVLLRGSVLNRIGGFDEQLGLGTAARSGEDTEFAMRAHLAARRTRYAPAKMIGHRDYGSALRGKYYAGALVGIARHARRSPQAILAFVRKLAVGAALVVRQEMKPAEFSAALAMVHANRATAPMGRPSDIRQPGIRP